MHSPAPRSRLLSSLLPADCDHVSEEQLPSPLSSLHSFPTGGQSGPTPSQKLQPKMHHLLITSGEKK